MWLCVSASLISRHTVHSGEGEATPPVSIGVHIVLLLVASVLVSVLCSFDNYDHVSSYAASYVCLHVTHVFPYYVTCKIAACSLVVCISML